MSKTEKEDCWCCSWCCDEFTAKYDEGYIRLGYGDSDDDDCNRERGFYVEMARGVMTNIVGARISHRVSRFRIGICPWCGKEPLKKK